MGALRPIVSFGALLVCLGHAGAAAAQTKVVVLGFSGPRGGTARSALVRAIADDVDLVDASDWREAADRIGARGRSSRAYARVARELGVTAIVTGSVSRSRRRRFSLSIAVRHGSTGRIVDSTGRSLRTLGAVGSAASSLSSRVLEIIGEAEGPGEGGAEAVDEGDEVEEVDAGDEGDEGDGATMDWSIEGGEGEAASEGGGEGGADVPEGAEESPIVPGVHQAEDVEGVPGTEEEGRGGSGGGGIAAGDLLVGGALGGWLEVGIELTAAARSFSLKINSTIDTMGRPGAQVDSGVFPEFGMQVRFFPLLLLSGEWWSGFGIEGSFHHHLVLSIFRESSDGQPPAEIEAGEYSYSVGLCYRAIIGSETVGATIWGRLGYGRFAFSMGPHNNDLVPPFEYDHVYALLSAYVPVGTPYLGIDLSAGYLGAISIGMEAAATYNERGSLPSSHGFDIYAGVSGQIWGGLRWHLGFELLGFVTTHMGVGRGWGINPTTVQGVDGGQGIETIEPTVDLFWRIVPGISYRFGGAESPAVGGGGGGGAEGGGAEPATGDWFEEAEEPEPAEEPEDEGEGEGEGEDEDEGAAGEDEEEGAAAEDEDDGWMTTD